MSRAPRVAVIGAGVTGLAVGWACGAPVFEQSDGPGGICRSYYLRPGSDERLPHVPSERDAYRFEVGGGHWIFGGDATTLAWLRDLTPFRDHERRAVVRLGSLGATVRYPLQAHLDDLGPVVSRRVAEEKVIAANDVEGNLTLRGWLRATFGDGLCELFFYPFHDRYTAGMTISIAPQDTYKSPATGGRGYNSSFCYPIGGLDSLAAQLAKGCDVRYQKRLVGIERDKRVLQFADGSEFGYDHLLSTLPLHEALAVAALDIGVVADPFTSVLVLNIGAERGSACPDVHWQYEPDSRSGFHRIGFYSNVALDFLPVGCRDGSRVSLYVERAFRGGQKPTAVDVDRYVDSVVTELQCRGYIERPDMVDQSWVDVAYTWRTPGSRWKERAIQQLAEAGIQQVGRYGRWQFQGIADSIQEGLMAGKALSG